MVVRPPLESMPCYLISVPGEIQSLKAVHQCRQRALPRTCSTNSRIPRLLAPARFCHSATPSRLSSVDAFPRSLPSRHPQFASEWPNGQRNSGSAMISHFSLTLDHEMPDAEVRRAVICFDNVGTHVSWPRFCEHWHSSSWGE